VSETTAAKVGGAHACAGGPPFFRALKFLRWMDSRRTPASIDAICDYFNVCRATAYRWRAAYQNAPRIDHVDDAE
jgi:hypothetical protein